MGLAMAGNYVSEVPSVPFTPRGTFPATPPATPPDYQYDQLMKLKSLLDRGIISQEEYDHKKRQILGI